MLKNKLQSIVRYGIVALYFLIAVSFYLGTYDSAQIKITIFHVGGLFVVMSWLLLKIEEGNILFLKKNFIYILPLILFLCSGMFSLACSPFKLASLNDFIRRFIYCGIVFILMDQFYEDKEILKIKNWLLAATAVVCLYGIVQVLDYYTIPGLDPFAWRQAFGNRIMSTFGNPNFFGDFLVVMSPIVLALCIYKKNIFIYILWLSIAFCTYSTFSKGAWLGFAAGIFVFFSMYVFMFLRNKLNKKTIIIASIFLLSIISIIGAGIHRKTLERTDSASFRVFAWLSTWEMVNTHPFLGTGIGTFYVTYPAWRRPQIFFIEGKHNTESDHPENEYLEVWYEEGIIGISIFLTLIISLFVIGYKNMVFLHSKNSESERLLLYIQLGVISAFSAQLVHDSVCVSLRFVSSGVMLWLLVGLTLAIAMRLRILNKEVEFENVNLLKRSVKTLLQLIVLTVFFIAILFTSRFFIADYLHARGIIISRNGNFTDAINTYDKVVKNNPSFIMPWYFKTSAYIERSEDGDMIRAAQALKRTWELAPNYVQSKYIAGSMYAKKFSKAVELLNRYIAEKRSQDIVGSQKKEVVENFNNAVKYYIQYIEIDPIYPATYYSLASLYLDVNKFDEAEQILKAHLEYPKRLQKPPHNFWVENWASRRSGEYVQTYRHLYSLYSHMGKTEDANEIYNKISNNKRSQT